MPEWILSAAMVGWGLITLGSPDLFITQPFYYPMLLVMGQLEWGITALVTGLVRLCFLVINGAWRPSAHIRAVGCFLGAMLWGKLLIAALGLAWLSPINALYFAALVLDIISLWFCAGDAKLADLAARGKNKI